MGSQFGQGSFKQAMLDWMLSEGERAGIDLYQSIEEMMEVLSHLMCSAYRRDEALKKMYEQARNDAKAEIVSKLNQWSGPTDAPDNSGGKPSPRRR
jgi:hypothetical protein